jgi:hypothetical protein
MNYFSRGREVTIELSYIYLLPASLLPSYWYYLSHSLLDFIENTFYGIRGTVKDSYGNPVKALVTVTGHDNDNSAVYSDSLTGSYLRMISPGMYNVTFSADSFVTKSVNNIKVTNYNASLLNVQLEPKLTAVESGSYFNINTYSLYQNYPNPFNPSTAIKYQIPQSGKVTLTIYDILGKEVARLVNGYKNAGNYNINFDASNLPTGIYFYQLKVNDFVSLKKMILIK